jgi:hypothetical protein
MIEIVERYNRMQREELRVCENLDRKIEQREAQIERLQKRRANVPCTHWTEDLIKPLAAELAARTGLSWELYDLRGMKTATSIYLRADMSKKITEQPTLRITLEPRRIDGLIVTFYRTGKKVGINCATAPLPDTIEEIEALLLENR